MNTPTPVLFDNQAREKILRGVYVLYEAVRRTMGPQGANALMYGLYSRPYRISNDGYTIADIIELKDPHEKLAASAIQDAAKRTNLLAGDGTTATTVIAGKLVNSILPMLMEEAETARFAKSVGGKEKRHGVMDLKRALFRTRDLVLSKLKEKSLPVDSLETLTKIATISVEHEEYGKIIADMAWKVGTSGYIDIVEGFGGKIETEVIEGARWPAKIAAKGFVNKLERYEMETTDAHVLLTNHVIDDHAMQVLFTESANLRGLPRIIIIAPNFKGSVLQVMFNVNQKNKAMTFAPIKCPSLRTEQFDDIAVITGAKFINKDKGDRLDRVVNDDLGWLGKLVVKDTDLREDCVAVGGRGTTTPLKEGIESPVQTRIRVLTEQIEATREESHKNVLRRRIAGLSSAVGVIKVSCDSEAETYYWKKKIEDAVYACKAALEEGFVSGGGLALKEIAEQLPGDDLLRSALLAPYEQIQENAEGIEIGEDVIDPTKAIRCAVEHAVSVSANLATVRVIIPEEVQRSPAEGYTDIANAIKMFNLLWAKERGIQIENEEEIAKDTMANHDNIMRGIVD